MKEIKMSDQPDRSSEELEPKELSLDELSEAFSQAIGGDSAEATDVPPGQSDETVDSDETDDVEVAEAPTDETTPPEIEPTEDDDPCEISPQSIFEAMLFVGDLENEPLTSARAAELMRGVTPGEIAGLVDQLNRRYASSGCPYRVTSQGSGYRLVLHKAFEKVRNKFYGRVREARLSQAAVDILAIVAYKQPLTAEIINGMRNTSSGHLLAQLVRRQLLRIDRPEGKGHATYHTTERFLELFGLESLNDLPRTEDTELGQRLEFSGK